MHQLAGSFILLAAALIVFFDWVPTPLNRNIAATPPRERLPSTLIHGTIGLVLATLCFAGLWPAYWVAAIWYAIVLASAINNWWIPYFTGRHSGEVTPEIYAREYAHNLTLLPRIGGNPVVPDVQHSLIHMSVLLAALFSLLAIISG